MIYYANGCSYTWGGALYKLMHEPDVWLPDLPDTHPVNTERLETVYPHHLGKLIGATRVINQSLGGGSNARIVRTTLDYFNKLLLEGENLKNHFVTIQWTSPERTEYYDSEKGSWVNIMSVGPTFVKDIGNNLDRAYENEKFKWLFYNIKTDLQDYHNFISQVYCLGNFFKVHNIPYLFFCHVNWHGPFWNFIDWKQYKKLMLQFNWVKDDPVDFNMAKSGLERVKDSHPSAKGHQQWANTLYQDIVKKKLLPNLSVL